jgi:hypothetical protein
MAVSSRHTGAIAEPGGYRDGSGCTYHDPERCGNLRQHHRGGRGDHSANDAIIAVWLATAWVATITTATTMASSKNSALAAASPTMLPGDSAGRNGTYSPVPD